LPHRGAGTPEGFLALDKLRLARMHGFAAAAHFSEMRAFHGRVGFAGEACKELLNEFGTPGARQSKCVGCDFCDGGSHAEKMRRMG
jgi:hypothetical protein